MGGLKRGWPTTVICVIFSLVLMAILFGSDSNKYSVLYFTAAATSSTVPPVKPVREVQQKKEAEAGVNKKTTTPDSSYRCVHALQGMLYTNIGWNRINSYPDSNHSQTTCEFQNVCYDLTKGAVRPTVICCLVFCALSLILKPASQFVSGA